MKQKFLLASLVLFIVIAQFASPEELFDGWVFSSDQFYADSTTHTLYVSDNLQKIRVDTYLESILIYNQSCGYTQQAKICLLNTSYDYTYKNTKAHITVSDNKDPIKLSKEIINDPTYVGDEIEINVVLNNTADQEITSIVYEERLPVEYTVTATRNCQVSADNVITFTTTIRKHKTYECTYTIQSYEQVNSYSVSKITYPYTDDTVESYSEPLDLVLESPVTISLPTLSQVKVKKEELFLGTLKNLRDTDEDLIITITPQSAVELKKNSDVSSNIYELEYTLLGNEEKKFNFTFKVLEEGVHTFDVVLKADDYIVRKTVRFDVDSTGVSLSTNFDKVMESSVEHRLFAFLHNDDEYQSIRDVRVQLTTPFVFVPTQTIETIKKNETIKVVDITFFSPSVQSQTKYTATLHVEYTKEDGTFKEKEFNYTIVADPVKDIEIIHTIQDNHLTSQERSTVTVQVKNNREIDLNGISLYDTTTLPKTGSFQILLDVPSKETVTAYTYTVFAPDVIQQTQYEIQTSASYQLYGQLRKYIKTTNITVDKQNQTKKVELKVTKSLGGTGPYLVGELVPINYVLKNTGEVELQSITVRFPLMNTSDVLKQTSTTIKTLKPQETVEVKGHEIRFIKEPINALPITTVEYYDNLWYNYTATSNAVSLTVKESSYKGPKIYVTQIPPESAVKDQQFQVSVRVVNLGGEGVVVSDSTSGVDVLVPGFSQQLYTYELLAEDIGEQVLERPLVYYTYNNHTYITSETNPHTVTIKRLAKSEIINSSSNPFNVSTEDTTKELEGSLEKETIFDKIKKMFSFIFGS